MQKSAFLEDIYPQNFLYGVTIRSPIANGYFNLIQFPKLPDNYTLITANQIPGENRLSDTSMPILADGKLSYIGEPIAILLGSDKTKLEEFASKCVVITDEKKGIFSAEETDTPVLTREIQFGEPVASFLEAGKIVTGSYKTGIQDQWYAEPNGAVTWYSGKSKTAPTLVVKSATQWPYHVKRSVARVLGIEQTSVSVEPTPLSLHMDGKLWYPSLIACHAALATFITKKPVRLILNKEEDFLFSPKRCNSSIDIASIIDDSGNITAAEIGISVNLGAYAVNSEEILDQICLGAIGFYDIKNFKLTAKANITNIPPQGPFSGFGLSQGFFATERHVSLIAGMVNQDPAQWRKSRINTSIILPAGSSKEAKAGDDLIESAAKMSDYYRKWASYELLRQGRHGKRHEKNDNPRGIGIAAGFQGNGLLYPGEDKGNYSVEVTLTKESVLEIKTSINSSEAYNKIWEKTASTTMSIEPEMVRIITEQAPDCGPSCASRNITAITGLVEKCCLAIRKQRFHSPLPITVRRAIKPQNGSLMKGRFTAHPGKHLDINGFSKLGMACAVVEVSMDLVECLPKIRGVWLAVDGGKIISLNRAKRSLTRNIIQALGWSFSEHIEYVEGKIEKHQFDNFSIPSPFDIPPVNIDFISGAKDVSKGIGEIPYTCIPAAFLQAVSQAMDHSFKSIPLKRNDIWEMIRLRHDDIPAQEPK